MKTLLIIGAVLFGLPCLALGLYIALHSLVRDSENRERGGEK